MIPKACPFCGLRETRAIADPNQGGKWGFIECPGCGARGPDVRTGYGPIAHWHSAAIEEWNKRYSEHEPRSNGSTENISLEDLSLSTRARLCLARADILSLRELLDRSYAELLQIYNCGKITAGEIIDELGAHGLTLRGRRP